MYILLIDTLLVCHRSPCRPCDDYLSANIEHRIDKVKAIKTGLTSGEKIAVGEIQPGDHIRHPIVRTVSWSNLLMYRRSWQNRRNQSTVLRSRGSIQQAPANLNFIIMIHALLCSVGIMNNKSTMGLLSCRELHFAFCTLILWRDFHLQWLGHEIL